MSNVVDLHPKAPDAIWSCSCGCVTFKAHTDQTLECARCGDIGQNVGGHWVKEPVPAKPDEPDEVQKVTSFGKTATMTLRDLVSEGADMAFVLAIRRCGKHTLWANPIETTEQLEWLERQFDNVRGMLVRPRA